jgi:hypothetical protein
MAQAFVKTANKHHWNCDMLPVICYTKTCVFLGGISLRLRNRPCPSERCLRKRKDWERISPVQKTKQSNRIYLRRMKDAKVQGTFAGWRVL